MRELRFAQNDSQGPQGSDTSKAEENKNSPANLDKESKETLDEIVVTGTHIRGVQGVAATFIMITRDEIENTGFSTLHDVFESLPQNFDAVSSDAWYAMGQSELGIANQERASSVDLRGLGAESTLTLLNGHRRAGSVNGRVVDVSAIPLSVIERVEVILGGKSAIYGSDAVAGVVNLVTRRNFEGLEAQVSYGSAAEYDGRSSLQLSTIGGTNSDRGGFVAAFDYQKGTALDLAETAFALPSNSDGSTTLRLDLQPEDRQYSGFLAGHYMINDRVELYMDGLYTSRDFDAMERYIYPGALSESFLSMVHSGDQYSASAGAKADVGRSWKIDVAGSGSVARREFSSDSVFDFGSFGFVSNSRAKEESKLSDVSVIADGPFFSIAKTSARAALGVQVRKESFERMRQGTPRQDGDRSIRSAFAEVQIPLVKDSRPGLQRIELSVAGRYDDYSDFGNTFNPQAGLIWEPIRGLTLNGSYSEAYRAPALFNLQPSNNVLLQNIADPTTGGNSPVMIWDGTNSGLGAEEATSWSVGLDYKPAVARWLRVFMSYFEIDYKNRIEVPTSFVDQQSVLEREARYPGLIDRSPTEAELRTIFGTDSNGVLINRTGTAFDPATQDFLDVFPNLIILDNRDNNIAVEYVDGVDFGLDTDFAMGFGSVNFGLSGTYTRSHTRSITAQSPSITLLNEAGKPVDLRIRAKMGWARSSYSSFLYLNYVDSYIDPFTIPPQKIASWTTVDLAMRFDDLQMGDGGPLDGFSAVFSIDNVLDEDPPNFVSGAFYGLGYDSANANPIGRYISVRLLKKW